MTRLTPCLSELYYNLNELFSSRFRSSSSPLACGSWVVPSTPSSMAPWIAHSEQSTRKYSLLSVALWSRPLAVRPLTTKKCRTAVTSTHESRRRQKSHKKRRNCASFPLLTHNQKGIHLLITYLSSFKLVRIARSNYHGDFKLKINHDTDYLFSSGNANFSFRS